MQLQRGPGPRKRGGGALAEAEPWQSWAQCSGKKSTASPNDRDESLHQSRHLQGTSREHILLPNKLRLLLDTCCQ